MKAEPPAGVAAVATDSIQGGSEMREDSGKIPIEPLPAQQNGTQVQKCMVLWCPVRKGAGTQRVVRCVSTTSGQ